ncbi:hypothetical protein [Catenuloplanes atrovinosus]|uniref:Uncharacterized protein n=1 Tax=Catenuloplanes atrovinosus TaxID=137266 RepID=A0AAE3YPN5_9ACTN|nr:hypothetical protein [Catenuloplanes atrovinosus]MDR7277718.1 hypothetical protein [Catenuloplanes atrovinosus]
MPDEQLTDDHAIADACAKLFHHRRPGSPHPDRDRVRQAATNIATQLLHLARSQRRLR